MATAAHLEEWTGENVSLAQIEDALAELRRESCEDTEGPDLRTSVMTHIAWVPREWHDVAWATLEGMAERHPSRAIVLVPDGSERDDDLLARVQVAAYELPGERRHVAAEIVELRLGRRRSHSPASIVMPLLISGLPVFCRWRGRPRFGEQELDELTQVADRFVIDSREWDDPVGDYPRLAALFDRVAVSDIAWRRTLPWRMALARDWPEVGRCGKLTVVGPAADANLLTGWLRARLGRDVELEHEPGDDVESVAVDGRELTAPPEDSRGSSALLSAELETFAREPVYEAAVSAAGRESA
jgi:glucose-6-phosphate dehydrogenase assembly protein OpcA